ncbi:MAG: FAD-dependent oxidoreductase, partial [Calditrichae bacterium]|nr:FAD-dependent oxidoreductase [Calditrichia bacterium]NIV72009.1 FAD-dependent oxidoreductase [Calditrichia bacterium]
MTSQKQTIETNTLVIGASAAGLAVDACLKKQDIPHLLVEKTNQVGTAWRNH